jgi:hypothetical protein
VAKKKGGGENLKIVVKTVNRVAKKKCMFVEKRLRRDFLSGSKLPIQILAAKIEQGIMCTSDFTRFWSALFARQCTQSRALINMLSTLSYKSWASFFKLLWKSIQTLLYM